MTNRELAALLGKSVRTVQRLRRRGELPEEAPAGAVATAPALADAEVLGNAGSVLLAMMDAPDWPAAKEVALEVLDHARLRMKPAK
jgi:hypothetical protein